MNSQSLTELLLELPEKIKVQSQKVADLVEAVENQRILVERIKNTHMDLVLSATQDGKPKFSNDKARQIALEKLLVDDEQYSDTYDALMHETRALKQAQIELEHLHNLFSAYKAVAGLQGVR